MENFTPENLLAIIIVLAGLWALKQLVQAWERSKSSGNTNLFSSIYVDDVLERIIEGVEQSMQGEEGAKKRETAISLFTNQLEKMGVKNLDEEFIAIMVESAVRTMNNKPSKE